MSKNIKRCLTISVIFLSCIIETFAQGISGKVVDTLNEPLQYMNVVVLASADSAFIKGVVTNEDGSFNADVPLGENYILKISSIEYETKYQDVTGGNVGVITMVDANHLLANVEVKATRPQYKMIAGGLSAPIENTILSKLGNSIEVIKQLPMIEVSSDDQISVFAKGTPLIYINNKKVLNVSELLQLKSSDIKSIDVITNPGARYDATVSSVILIKTIHKQGDGLGIVTDNKLFVNGKGISGYTDENVKFRFGGFDVFGEGMVWGANSGEKNFTSDNFISGDLKVVQYDEMSSKDKDHYWKVGCNYDVDDKQSFGLTYSVQKSSAKISSDEMWQKVFRHSSENDFVDQMFDSDGTTYSKEANVYYCNRFGKLNVDFNGSWTNVVTENVRFVSEESNDIEDRNVHSNSDGDNSMYAGKLLFSYPLLTGKLNFGSEVTHVISKGKYQNAENYVDSSDSRVEEINDACFVEYSWSKNNFSVELGIRYENVTSNYYAFNVKDNELSRRYNNFFPSLSLMYDVNDFGVQLSYTNKTRRPSYRSLRSDVQYDNRYLYESGNPYLVPMKQNVLDLYLGWKSVYFMASCNSIHNSFEDIICLYDNQSEIGLITKRNFGKKNVLSASFVMSPKLAFYQPTFELNYIQQFFDTEGITVSQNLRMPNFGFYVKNKFVFNDSFGMLVNLRYSTKMANGFAVKKAAGSVDLKLLKTLFNKKMTLSVFVNDILKTKKDRIDIYGDGMILSKDAYNFTRSCGFTLAYNYNISKSKYKGTGAGISEKNRF